MVPRKDAGVCILADGSNSTGVVKLDEFDGFTPQRHEACFKKCEAYKNATGCEMVWNDWFNKGCYVHTDNVTKGDGTENRACWIWEKKCNATGTGRM